MFSGFISALQGPAEEAVDDADTSVIATSQSAPLLDAHTSTAELLAEEQPSASTDQEAETGLDSAGAEQHEAQPHAHAAAAEAPRSASVSPQRPRGAAEAKAAAAPSAAAQQGSWWGMASGIVDTVRKGTNELAARYQACLCCPPCSLAVLSMARRLLLWAMPAWHC